MSLSKSLLRAVLVRLEEIDVRRGHRAMVGSVTELLLGTASLPALDLSLSRLDMKRALAIARWPSSDRDRARFHEAYIFHVDGPTVEYITVDRIEVITEFRRLELMAEQHEGVKDNWGRAGFQDVEEAVRPWRDRVSIVTHLRFDGANRVIPILPAVTIRLGGDHNILPIDVRPAAIVGRGAPTGERLEAMFDAKAVGQASHPIFVRWDGRELARLTIDFARLE